MSDEEIIKIVDENERKSEESKEEFSKAAKTIEKGL